MYDTGKTIVGVFVALLLYGWWRRGGGTVQGFLGAAGAGVSGAAGAPALSPHQVADSTSGSSSTPSAGGCGCGSGNNIVQAAVQSVTRASGGPYAYFPIA